MKQIGIPNHSVANPPKELPTAVITLHANPLRVMAFLRYSSSVVTSMETIADLFGSYIAATIICNAVAMYNAVMDATNDPNTSNIQTLFYDHIMFLVVYIVEC